MAEKKNPHALPIKEKWIKLTAKEVKHIFIYYIILFFTALVLCARMTNDLFPPAETGIKLIELSSFSFVFGLLGSTFYYIRKLYKSCIQLLVDSSGADTSIPSMGVKVYFYLRPVMGAVLATLIILGIYGGFFFLQDEPSINDEKFYIFSAIFSFVVGFSNGKIIVRLDNSSDKIAELIKIAKED